MSIETLSEHRCHGGVQGFYRHASQATGTPMRFAVYVPPAADSAPVPVLYFLAGLTCTEETAAIKAGMQAHASRLGLALVMPDTSPRGAEVPGEDDDWDLGTGAGFYVDASAAPWSRHYRMHRYVTDELRACVEASFPVDGAASGVLGHSMGGHGALVAALREPGRYRSVSAFAPIAAPMHCPWGEKAFSAYLGGDRERWRAWDACELVRERPIEVEILVDQGLADPFLAEQLHPDRLERACAEAGQALRLRRHDGYDHGYWFIQSFVADHLEHHARALGA